MEFIRVNGGGARLEGGGARLEGDGARLGGAEVMDMEVEMEIGRGDIWSS